LQREILWHLKGVNAVGGDVVEVSPPYDLNGGTAVVGAIVAMDILHILGEARTARVNAEISRLDEGTSAG